MREIERKFLVKDLSFKKEAFKEESIKQGYLNSHPERTTRVRIKRKKGFMTVKGISSEDGLERFEWEMEIPLKDAESLLQLCEPGVIEKTRFYVKFEKHVFEVDEFYGKHRGLVLAEVELASKDEEVKLPAWLGKEVTGDKRYYNSYLSKHTL